MARKVKSKTNNNKRQITPPPKVDKPVEFIEVVEEIEDNDDDNNGNDDEENGEEEEVKEININVLEESDGDDDADDLIEEKIELKGSVSNDEDDYDDEKEDADDIPLSEAELDSDADVIPYTKLTINNKAALRDSLSRIQIPWEKYQFDENQTVTYHTNVESQIKDIYDDTERELQFFKQGLDAALEGRKNLLALKIPFARPMDYFAEMVKSDEHMEKLKVKLVQEATEKKARDEARRQRQLKKFGKQVQHETLQQRQKDKRDTLDKIKSLKKKRKNNEIGNDAFDIAVEDASAGKDERQRFKKQKIQQSVGQKSGGSKQRPGKNRRRNKKKN